MIEYSTKSLKEKIEVLRIAGPRWVSAAAEIDEHWRIEAGNENQQDKNMVNPDVVVHCIRRST